MKITREIKAAIIVVAGIAAFYIGFNFLRSKSLFHKTNTYYAYFPHSGGLKTGTQITVNGVKVGSVEAVDLEEKTARIKITMECSENFTFSKNSVAELYNSLLGGAGLQIIPAFDDAPIAVSGDELKSHIQEDMLASVTSSLKPTQEKLTHLLVQADTTLTSVNKILDTKTTEDLKKAIAELSNTMQHLNQASVSLNAMLSANQASLRNTLQNADKITTDLSKVSGELSAAELNKVIADAQTTLSNLNTLLSDISSGKGTIGKLMKDEALYKDLDNSAKELELLLQDFRLNPKRYVHFSLFGKKATIYEPINEEKAE
ncbi:MAG: MlaD family protein [Capnocytophaga sp.]|uniref:MlaD family protein n=1 Tax=Capnocytophaga sp. TaxID=44737 RepID=UPI003F9FFF66